MRKLLTTVKRSLAVLLSSAVIVTSMPQIGMAAYAASLDDSIAVNGENVSSAQEDFSSGGGRK